VGCDKFQDSDGSILGKKKGEWMKKRQTKSDIQLHLFVSLSGFEAFVNQIWQFLQSILESERLHSILKSHLTPLIYIGVAYIQLTNDQQQQV
jgi:hypothetical protein